MRDMKWYKDGNIVHSRDLTFSESTTLIDKELVIFRYNLSSDSANNFVGSIRCEVVRWNDSKIEASGEIYSGFRALIGIVKQSMFILKVTKYPTLHV